MSFARWRGHDARMQMTATPNLVLRPAQVDDAERCATIFYDAFESIASRHNLPIEPGTREFTAFKMNQLLSEEGVVGLIAERAGQIVGSAFVDERDLIAGIGPVIVDPDHQDGGVGLALMQALLARERDRAAVGVRLVQTAYHYRSLALYAKLGFVIREPLSVMQGPVPTYTVPGIGVRPATEADLAPCAALCTQVHGHDRTQELRGAIAVGTATVAEGPAGICAYATGFGYGWHAVGTTTEALAALISSAETFMGLGILVPSRDAALMRWCLEHGLRIVQQSTLMSIGLYNEPAGAYLPSILY
jgi:predicted N-acetyltransferase YhbS